MAIDKHPRVLASERALLDIVSAHALADRNIAAPQSTPSVVHVVHVERIAHRIGVYMPDPDPKQRPFDVFVWDAALHGDTIPEGAEQMGGPALFTALAFLPPDYMRVKALANLDAGFSLPSVETVSAACRVKALRSADAFPLTVTVYESLRFTFRGDDVSVVPAPTLRVNRNIAASPARIAAAVRDAPSLPFSFFVGENLRCDRRGYRLVVWKDGEDAPDVPPLDAPLASEPDAPPAPEKNLVDQMIDTVSKAGATAVREVSKLLLKPGEKLPAPMEVSLKHRVTHLGGVSMATHIHSYDLVIGPGVATPLDALRRALAFRRVDVMTDAEFPFPFHHGEKLLAMPHGEPGACEVSVVLESQIPETDPLVIDPSVEVVSS